jgi:hypothetical protein
VSIRVSHALAVQTSVDVDVLGIVLLSLFTLVLVIGIIRIRRSQQVYLALFAVLVACVVLVPHVMAMMPIPLNAPPGDNRYRAASLISRAGVVGFAAALAVITAALAAAPLVVNPVPVIIGGYVVYVRRSADGAANFLALERQLAAVVQRANKLGLKREPKYNGGILEYNEGSRSSVGAKSLPMLTELCLRATTVYLASNKKEFLTICIDAPDRLGRRFRHDCGHRHSHSLDVDDGPSPGWISLDEVLTALQKANARVVCVNYDTLGGAAEQDMLDTHVPGHWTILWRIAHQLNRESVRKSIGFTLRRGTKLFCDDLAADEHGAPIEHRTNPELL